MKVKQKGHERGSSAAQGEQELSGSGSSSAALQLKGMALAEQQATLSPERVAYDAQSAELAPVQAKGKEDVGTVHRAAEAGTQGSGGSLPHLAAIQQSFGHHDVSGVQAYTGGTAASANRAMGAEAYATGNKIAFGTSSPSLHTAAHEAAHVIQQQAGVSLSGGVGKAGDPYEEHADAVADAVVSGQSAAGLLDKMTGGGGGGGVQRKAVQREEPPPGVIYDDENQECIPVEDSGGGSSTGGGGSNVPDIAGENSLGNEDKGTSVSASIGTQGAEVKVAKELIPSRVEAQLPIYGVPGAGIWISVRPSLVINGKAGGKYAGEDAGSISMEGGITGSVAVNLKGGLDFANVFGGGTLTADVKGLSIKRDAQGQWSVGALVCEIKGNLQCGFEVKAEISESLSFGKKWEWKPGGDKELLVLSAGGWQEGAGLQGPSWKPGKDLQVFIDKIKAAIAEAQRAWEAVKETAREVIEAHGEASEAHYEATGQPIIPMGPGKM